MEKVKRKRRLIIQMEERQKENGIESLIIKQRLRRLMRRFWIWVGVRIKVNVLKMNLFGEIERKLGDD